MNRRKFLAVLAGAATTPVLPVPEAAPTAYDFITFFEPVPYRPLVLIVSEHMEAIAREFFVDKLILVDKPIPGPRGLNVLFDEQA